MKPNIGSQFTTDQAKVRSSLAGLSGLLTEKFGWVRSQPKGSRQQSSRQSAVGSGTKAQHSSMKDTLPKGGRGEKEGTGYVPVDLLGSFPQARETLPHRHTPDLATW